MTHVDLCRESSPHTSGGDRPITCDLVAGHVRDLKAQCVTFTGNYWHEMERKIQVYIFS